MVPVLLLQLFSFWALENISEGFLKMEERGYLEILSGRG